MKHYQYSILTDPRCELGQLRIMSDDKGNWYATDIYHNQLTLPCPNAELAILHGRIASDIPTTVADYVCEISHVTVGDSFGQSPNCTWCGWHRMYHRKS